MVLTTGEVERMIGDGESLRVEFKGERRESISDREIYETVVCLANNAGGVVLLGVENGGNDAVRLVLRGGEASLAFAAFVFRQDRERKPLTLDEMLVLNCLQHQRRIDAPSAGSLIQKGEHQGRAVLERLVERGLVEARGERRGRAYHLSAGLYRELDAPAGYVRSRGFDPIQQEAMVLQYVQAHGRVTRGDAMNLCMITGRQATKLLRRLADAGKLRAKGSPPRWVYYELPGRGQ